MPKGTRRVRSVSKSSGGTLFGANPAKGSISKGKAQALVGDNGLKRLNEYPSDERRVYSDGKDYLSPTGRKMVAAKKAGEKAQAKKRAASNQVKSSVKKAVKSAVKKVKASAKKGK